MQNFPNLKWKQIRLKHLFRKCADTRLGRWEAHFSVTTRGGDIQWNPFSPTALNTLLTEQMAAVKEELLDFRSIEETFCQILYSHAASPPCWAIFTAVTFWIFNTSARSRMLFSQTLTLFHVTGVFCSNVWVLFYPDTCKLWVWSSVGNVFF